MNLFTCIRLYFRCAVQNVEGIHKGYMGEGSALAVASFPVEAAALTRAGFM